MSPAKYILIDYENVQPANLDQLRDQGYLVRVFLGAVQDRLPLSMVRRLQVLGPSLEYIQTSGSGRNALDFYIAYYLGRKSLEAPSARFYIISGDMGFDPLLRHLRSQGIACRRVGGIDEIRDEQALVEQMRSLPADDMLVRARARLSIPFMTRPRTVKTLRSTINAIFAKKLNVTQLDDMIFALKTEGFLTEITPRVTYRLDDQPQDAEAQPADCNVPDTKKTDELIAALLN
jgi:hypothetical protein